MMLEIPQVKIGRIGLKTTGKVSDKDYLAIGQELHSAFVSHGFVYLLDHGVSEEAISDIFQSSAVFFTKSLAEKKRAFPRDPKTFQGYVPCGLELLEEERQTGKYGDRETMDVYSLSDDSPYPDTLVPELRSHFKAIGDQLLELGLRVLQSLALALKLDKRFFLDCHQHLLKPGNLTLLRSLYYPAIKGSVQPGALRCGEHTDYGSLTFLLQDDLGGLEAKVKSAGEKWIEAKPVRGSIIVNLGDLMEVFTNGLYPATVHRVVVPEEELIRRQSRQSFAFFISPDNDTIVKPIHEEEPKKEKYQAVESGDYHLRMYAKTFSE